MTNKNGNEKERKEKKNSEVVFNVSTSEYLITVTQNAYESRVQNVVHALSCEGLNSTPIL